MTEKILYYLGAGASAQALPLAKSIHSNLPIKPAILIPGLAYELSQFCNELISTKTIEKSISGKIEDIAKTAENISKQADYFGDVDTYAKYLHLTDASGNELKKLKQTVSQYFAIKQMVLDAKDKRYLPWLVSIMSKKTFPSNVKILSWNYDFQVEIAMSTLNGTAEDINHSSTGFVYSPPLFSYYPNLDPTFRDFSDLSLIHLNGIAGYTKDDFHTGSIFQSANKNDVTSCLKFTTSNNFDNMINFVWENTGYHETLMNHVENMVRGTTIMVIIGYSFPFFNREVDKEIFRMLKTDSSLRKIYYQDPKLDGQQLKSQFDLNRDFPIQHISQIENFHIPFEY